MSLYDRRNNRAEIQAYYAVSLNRFQMDAHSHDRCELMYVESGACLIDAGASQFTLEERHFSFWISIFTTG